MVEADKLAEYIAILDQSVERLERFSLSALQITEFKAGNRVVHKMNLKVKSHIEKSVTRLKNKIHKKRLHVLYNLNDDISINADPELFENCIYEIIDNAIDHSPENGKIVINIYSTEPDKVTIETLDSGEGFEQKILNNPFKFFVKSDRFIGKNIGFDLAYVKLIIDAHSGNIELSNTTEGGACVRLILDQGTILNP